MAKTQKTINKIVAHLKKKKASAASQKFAEVYLHASLESELSAMDSKALADQVIDVFDSFKKWSGRPQVRVHNPEYTRHSVAEIHMKDMPFIVDSLWGELNRRGYDIHHTFHPVIACKRDKNKVLRSFDLNCPDKIADANYKSESLVHIEFERQEESELKAIKSDLLRIMGQVSHVTADFTKMVSQMEKCAKEAEKSKKFSEEVDFFNWLVDGHFIFLGYRHYDLKGTGKKITMGTTMGSGLGVMRDDKSSSLVTPRNFDDLPENLKYYLEKGDLVTVTKAHTKATVHRTVNMDYIGVKEYNSKGKVIGEHRFIGLLTSKAYTSNPTNIPLIRSKIAYVLEKEKRFAPTTHNYKALVNILETYPMDELFQITREDLDRISVGILNLKERQRIRLFVRHSQHENSITAMVFIPNDLMSGKLRRQIVSILSDVYHAEDVEYLTTLGESNLARLYLKIRSQIPASEHASDDVVEQMIVRATASWGDDLKQSLLENYNEAEAKKLYAHYAQAFRVGYQENTNAKDALSDIQCLEDLDAHPTKDIAINVTTTDSKELHLKVFHKGERIQLSTIMPLFDHMGLQILDEHPSRVRTSNNEEVWIHDFEIIQSEQNTKLLTDEKVRQNLIQAIELAWAGTLENDQLNSLIVTAGMNVRETVILRALLAYLAQIGVRYSTDYTRRTLIKHSAISSKLVQLFDARFDPNLTDKQRKSQEKSTLRQIEKMLCEVSVLDEDVIIQRLRSIILATVRTNAWQRKFDTDALSFKIRSSLVEDLVKPHPLFEIFVYHTTVEGIHLRGGSVARGGLRWSDRPADFRTEVLGLMKTQMTKNAVIVPVGSKGGFVLKENPCNPDVDYCDRQALMKAVQAAYSTFISSLICLTDNLKDSKPVAPRAVVRHDDDDPYLVVAADKGTATFSDIANGIAMDADHWDGIKDGFWLGDAFASGGSNGYDHKKMGITAKGAWECVKHHFRQRGKDIQNEDFTVVGIGDMAGDVFGNGMLLSKHIRLQAAFNHMHIFIDPNPDSATSWKERQRMFKKAGVTWEDYNPKLISKGGGIFSRKDKQIDLSPEMKEMLGTASSKMTPDDLIRHLLKMDVELLWNGGIGTFIKATDESHGQVGDRSNDQIRIDATELNAKVIGEGGNLGMTQKARIQYSLNGGLINTDAIDNSAGVDCSDHEVNIKILLGLAQEKKLLNIKERNTLLESMTDEVSELSMNANYRQAKILGVAEKNSVEAIDPQIRLIKGLAKKGLLDARIEFLPNEDEISHRRKNKLGLTRPELSVVMAYAKSELFTNLLETKLPDEAVLENDYLYSYFPTALQARYKNLMQQHPLKREIISTVVSNDVINYMGLTFMDRMRDETGHPECTITRAYLIAQKLFNAREWWNAIDALDNKVEASTQLLMRRTLKKLIESTAFWFLRSGHERPLSIEKALNKYCSAFSEVISGIEKHMTPAMQKHHEGRTKVWMGRGLSREMGKTWGLIEILKCAPDIATIALTSKVSVERAMQVHFHIGEAMRLDVLHQRTQDIPVDDNWQRVASQSLREGFYSAQLEITCQSLKMTKKNEKPQVAYTMWKESKTSALDRYFSLVEEVSAYDTASISMMNVVLGQLRGLV